MEPKVAEAATDDATTRIFRFLSNASNEQLLLTFLITAFCIYIIIDGIFILLVGALAGFILHIIYSDNRSTLNVPDYLVTCDHSHEALVIKDSPKFEEFKPKTATALNELVDAIVRDYIKHWYNPILPSEETFLIASRLSLTKFILSISQRLSRKRPADTFLEFLTNSSSIVIVFLNELANATPAGSNKPVGELVTAYLTANKDCNLANMTNQNLQKEKFTLAADDILRNFLEKSLYDSVPVRVFLREILAGVILEMTLKSCSTPEFINGWIVYLLEDGEPSLGQVIDEAMDRRNIKDPFSDIDENVRITRSPKKPVHQRRLSDEEATNEAMAEAKRLSLLIAEDEARKLAQIGNVEEEKIEVLGDEKTKENLQPNLPPITPTTEAMTPASPLSPTTPLSASPFTSFDQIVPQAPIALQANTTSPQRRNTVTLTLHNANIIVYDDSIASDKGRIKSRPIIDYMVQIEPKSSIHPGWMIVRRYSDFETLHEVLGRIAKVSGATAFIKQHQDLPNWKTNTKPSLRAELERYLKDALAQQPLAESEGMKRFLEKDQGTMPAPIAKAGFSWPSSSLENMGKGVFDTLRSAPKGAAAGVTGVFSNIGSLAQKRSSQSSLRSQSRISTSALSRVDSTTSSNGSTFESKRESSSEESLKAASVVSQPGKTASIGRKLSRGSIPGAEEESGVRSRGSSVSSHMSTAYSPAHSREPSQAPLANGTPLPPTTIEDSEELYLPPPPTEMPDDYTSPVDRSAYQALLSNNDTPRSSMSTTSSSEATAPEVPVASVITELSKAPIVSVAPETSEAPIVAAVSELSKAPEAAKAPEAPKAPKAPAVAKPLNEEETKVAVELLFAIITELYTLSGAWNIRRTLLTAAKTFLLRPGNPSLVSIQELIQSSVIEAYTSDAGIASSLEKLRQNALPTEAELKAWPSELSAEEKDSLRIKARKLLLERGMPIALTGVMGAAATGEALGKVFDALQEPEIGRGFVFGLLLQGVKALIN